MPRPKKFRVAVAGDTVDGRVIEAQWLKEAAETFDPKTYGVRVNVEHIRGLSGDKPFGCIGDVIGLSVQEDTLHIGGKAETRTCLYAEIQPNERALELNKADQKVYTSIELFENFAKTGKFGLIGLAVTDTPASLGTERLQFSKASGSLIAPGHEVELKFDEDAPTESQSAYNVAMKALSAAVTALTGGAKPDPKPEPKPEPAAAPGLEAFASALTAQTNAITALAANFKESTDALRRELDTYRRDFDALKTDLEATPAPTTFNRAPATGGSGDAYY